MLLRQEVLVAMALGLAMSVLARAQSAPKPAAESASVLLEKGIYTEETVGDLDNAIKIYWQVIEEGSANRRFVAQAQYRLGSAYLKKKQPKEALRILERLVAEFPEEKELAEEAGKRITEAQTALGTAKGSATAAALQVVGTQPKPFANDIDPSLDKITVTFSKPMVDRSWSWTGGGDTYPKITGKISYDASRRTCTLPVELEPGKVYWVGINSPSHKNFRSTDGQAAPWFIILFATRSADGKPTEIPEEMLTKARSINAAVATPAPTVTKSNPAPLAENVSPTLDRITVSFDQAMLDRSWSWTGGGETYPKVSGRPSYDASKRTCTLPVKLEPGKVYWVGINSPSYQNFQNANHVPAKRFVILFATADASGQPTPIPADLAEKAKAINAASGAGAAAAKEKP